MDEVTGGAAGRIQDLFAERIRFFPPVTFVVLALGERERGRVKISQEFFYPAEMEP